MFLKSHRASQHCIVRIRDSLPQLIYSFCSFKRLILSFHCSEIIYASSSSKLGSLKAALYHSLNNSIKQSSDLIVE